jgi:competence protein ComEC
VTQLANGGFVALSLKPDALADDCARATLLVTARQTPPACASMVIDRERLQRQGTIALRRTRDGFAVEAVRPKGYDRPWSPAVAGDTETEAALVRPAAVPKAVDATPAEADQQGEE